MNLADEAIWNLERVRKAIDQVRYPNAYNMAYKVPLNFFLGHDVEDAARILIQKYEMGIDYE